MKKISSFICALLILLLIVSVQQINADVQSDMQTVDLPGTQVLNLHSEINGKDYKLDISLPRDYDDTSKTFPTLYVLDGQWDFPLAYAVYGQLFYDGMVPSMVIVGMTWGGENPNHDSLRAQDYTQTNNMQIPQSGGAPTFLKVVKEEIIPFIASNYRVKDDDRALMGCSFAGLFTLYSMFSEPELFDKYISASPAIAWDNGNMLKIEKEFSESHSSLPAKLYLTVGEYENYQYLQSFAKTIEDRNYDGLQMETSVLTNTGHGGVKAEGYSRGMRFVYKYPELTLDDKLLDQYAGMYANDQGIRVQLVKREHNLVAILPTLQQIKLKAKNETEFYVPGVFNFTDIEKDDSGKVTGFLLRQFGGNTHFSKIEQ